MKTLQPKASAVLGALVGLVVLALIAMSQATPQNLTGDMGRKCITQTSRSGEVTLKCRKVFQSPNARDFGKVPGIRNPR